MPTRDQEICICSDRKKLKEFILETVEEKISEKYINGFMDFRYPWNGMQDSIRDLVNDIINGETPD